MRIAMVSEHANPLAALGTVDAGGQNVHVGALAGELAALGHQVTVYTRREDPDSPRRTVLRHCRDGGTALVELVDAGPAKPVPKDDLEPYLPEFARSLTRSWEGRRPDVVHAHYWMSGVVACTAAGAGGIPVVQTYHALGVVKRRHQQGEDTSPPTRVEAERWIGQTCAHIIATCSDEVFELVRMGVPRERISIVPCGVDLESFRPDRDGTEPGDFAAQGLEAQVEAQDLAAENYEADGLGTVGWRADPGAERLRLLSVGRLVRRKGFDTIIEALAAVPEAELLIAGGPPRAELGADPEARRLQMLARRCGVADRVGLLGGVERTRMPGLLRAADLAVCVPWYEPFGMVPLEAMACGTPVVAAAVGGLTDTVVDGLTGALVAPRDPAALAGVLGELARDPARRADYADAGLARARERYGWRRVAERTAAVYTRVTARTSRPSRDAVTTTHPRRQA